MKDFAQGKTCPPTNGSKPKQSPQHAAFVKQIVRVMRLTAIFLLVACLQVSARGYTQGKVTLDMKNAPLADVFKKIRKQTGYNFLCQVAWLEKAHNVDIQVKNVSLKEALDVCFKDQPLSYMLTGTTVVVGLKTEQPKTNQPTQSATDIKGRVINGQGEPLAGANIFVKRTGKGTIADEKGNFSLSNVEGDDIITVSYVGYQTQSIKVNSSTNLILTLSIANNELDETIIQAYGTTTRRLATGNISKVSASEIEKQPGMNVLLALQGRVPGLDVTQVNGFASAPIKVELRGRSTIDPKFTADPLYIIDGVPLTVLEVSGRSSYANGSYGFLQGNNAGPAGGQSPLFSINPADIESIEVLKDADATAIYGSRGANGVILITTKKGKAGKNRFDLNVQEGLSRVTRFYKLLNTQQYLAMRREAVNNDGFGAFLTPAFASYFYDLVLWDTTRYTDWQKELYGGTGKNLNVQAGLSGGDVHNTYRLGAGYTRNTNITTVSGADQRASFSMNLVHRSNDEKFKISLSGIYSFTQSDMINLPGAITYAPDAPPIYDSAGNLNYAGWGGNTNNTTARGSYPFAGLKQPYTSKTNLLTSNLIFNYKPIKELEFNLSLGYNASQANQQQLSLIASKDPITNPTGSASFGYNTNKNWIIEPQASYGVILGKGRLNALLGASVQQTNTNGFSVSGSGYTNDALIKTIAAAATVTNNENYGEYKYAAVFGRVNYIWDNKYILNLSTRRDGSSRFGEANRYANFGAIGAGWIITEEKWMKRFSPVLSFAKLRVSYGTTGSDAIGDYAYLTRWTSNNTQPYLGSPSLMPIQHANPDFQWQVNKKLEGAIDLGFFSDRVNLSVSHYRNKCGNQLISYPTAAFTGFSSVSANSLALVDNSGWEFSLSAKIINSKNFSWSLTGNIATNKNKLVSYPNFELSPFYYDYEIGKPLNIKKLLKYTGVDPQTGTYTYFDKNKDGTQDLYDRYTYSLNPGFFGGVGTEFDYKNFGLSMYFNIRKQIGMNGSPAALDQYPGAINVNMPVAVLNHWRKAGDVAEFARYTQLKTNTTDFYYRYSDQLYQDASFIRLQNLTLVYNLPSAYVKKIRMQNCKLYAIASNLFLVTKYKGIDPETQSFGNLPPAKTIIVGINFNF